MAITPKEIKTMAYAMTEYEWTVECEDEHGDIQDVEPADSKDSALFMAKQMTGHSIKVCLVRDHGPRLQERSWAYLKDGVLPETFSDSGGMDTGVKVPKRFR